jgi:hypothetical protein
MRKLASALFGSALLLSIAPASAESDGPYPWAREVADSGERRWYGWQTIIVDTTSLVVVPRVYLDTERDAHLAAGLVGYGVVAPGLHAVHGSVGKTFGSFALRASFPYIGGAIGKSTAECSGGFDFCPWVEEMVGMWLGAVHAAALDAAWLAWDEDPTPTGWAISVVPDVSTERVGAHVHAGGTF